MARSDALGSGTPGSGAGLNVDAAGGSLVVDGSVEPGPPPVNWCDVAVLVGTTLLWVAIMGLAARASGLSAWSTSSWDRWDSGHYLRIAESGYAFERCDGVANRGPADWCGSSGWFPGYPYVMRVGGMFGPSHQVVGRAVSSTAMVVAFCTLWFGFLRRRPFVPAIATMAIAAAFPSSVYYGAIFPISIVVAAMLLALVCVDRQRWLLAGCCGAVAAVVYPSGVVIGVVALVPLLSSVVGDARSRVRAAALVGVPIAVGYALVLANFQRATGYWNAWFKTQSSYDFDRTFPLQTVARQIGHLGDDVIPGVIGVQTMLVMVMVVAAGYVVVSRRHDLSLGERGAALVVAMLWVIPLTLGGDLSLYRAESLLLPVVVLLVRLRAWLLTGLAVVCIVVGYEMAQLFFDNILI